MTRPLALSNNQAGPILSCCTSHSSLATTEGAASGTLIRGNRQNFSDSLILWSWKVLWLITHLQVIDNLPRYRSADISCTFGSPSIPEAFSSQYMKETLRNFAESPETSKHWWPPKLISNDSSQGPPWGFSPYFGWTTIGWIKPDLVQTCFPACEF